MGFMLGESSGAVTLRTEDFAGWRWLYPELDVDDGASNSERPGL